MNLVGKKKQMKEIKKVEDEDISLWQKLVNGIVRPPRAKYYQMQLGSQFFNCKDRRYVRLDCKVPHQGKILQLTIYQAQPKGKYIILYMHGNSSCRVEALGLVRFLHEGISLASFDFMGCGRNQQIQTISLGFREAEQAQTIAQYLRNLGYIVILWGRSMGAATSLLYGKAQFIVADSSYKSFKSLCKQVAKQHSPSVVPNFMINCFFPCVFTKLKSDIDKKANYNIEDLDVREAVKKLDPNTIVIFMSGENDKLIAPRNSTKLFNICPCKKKYLKIFEGDHNSKRPDKVMHEVMDLILQHIQQKQFSSIASENIILQFE